jgi:hypothetical protein
MSGIGLFLHHAMEQVITAWPRPGGQRTVPLLNWRGMRRVPLSPMLTSGGPLGPLNTTSLRTISKTLRLSVNDPGILWIGQGCIKCLCAKPFCTTVRHVLTFPNFGRCCMGCTTVLQGILATPQFGMPFPPLRKESGPRSHIVK